jgi:ubiquinone/menaquinone biosynthesis C-methylase UbiE
LRWLFAPERVRLINTPVDHLPELLPMQPGARVLDIGCGQMSLLIRLAARVPLAAGSSGIDVSTIMLRLARRALQQRSLDRVLFVLHASGTALPFRTASFDAVLCSHLLKHLSDTDVLALLREAYRVLRPGGRLLIWEFAPPPHPALLSSYLWVARVLLRAPRIYALRDEAALAELGRAAGFTHARRLRAGIFLFPPLPRVNLVLERA